MIVSKILLPTDGSETAKKAIKYAADLAKQIGATVRLISVIDNSFYATQSVPVGTVSPRLLEPIEDYLRQAAEAYLDNAEKICGKNGVQSKKIIKTGHPVEEIIKEANRSKVDLIVLGSHGKSALKAAVLGSVTFGIIHKDTKIPVLVVRR
jgi:nucleotide-binding universal stress UspA family protein